MKKVVIFILVFALFVGIFIFFIQKNTTTEIPSVMSLDQYKIYIVNELVKEHYGGALEGYDAQTLLEVFGGLLNDDFDGLHTPHGTYEKSGGGVAFRPTEGGFSEEKLFLDTESLFILLDKVSKRLLIPIDTREGFETLITAIQ